MNYLEKQEERKKIKDLFLTNYPEGCIKITKGESHLHSKVKAEIAHWLKSNGYEVWSEPTLRGLQKRPDLICLHSNGNSAYIIEIVKSESKSSLINKSKSYPLPIIIVNASSFKYQEFKL